MNILCLLCALLSNGAGAAPSAVVIATTRGQRAVPVSVARGHPALPASSLEALLPMESEVDVDWATVRFAQQPFRFLLEAPLFTFRNRVIPLAGGAYVSGDTLYVPLQWLAIYVPQLFSEQYRYDPATARFEEAGVTAVASRGGESVPAVPRRPASAAAAGTGLHYHHKVVLDPGHGGREPGNPGRFFPRGVNEKHVTLSIATALRAELERRGIEVVMTRTTDTYPALEARAPLCREDCDLFVSIHVNSLRAVRGYERVRGIETYFFDEALTADAARVAAMENEFLRDATGLDLDNEDPLGFIFKDLQRNEFLRESAVLADLVQDRAATVHPGGGKRVVQANFAVLRGARRPAILIETGYATNRGDAAYLTSPRGQRELSGAIADGIIAYLLRYESKTAAPAQR
jgi:N-acetylmuramoyl-L-alanine amidase